MSGKQKTKARKAPVFLIVVLIILLLLFGFWAVLGSAVKAEIAFKQGYYADAVSLLSKYKTDNEKMVEIKTTVNAYYSYDEGYYGAAIRYLRSLDGGRDLPLYKKAVDKFYSSTMNSIKNAVKTCDYESFTTSLEDYIRISDDPETLCSETVDYIKEECGNGSYFAFLAGDFLAENTSGSLKDDITAFLSENALNRAKVFLTRCWVRQDDEAALGGLKIEISFSDEDGNAVICDTDQLEDNPYNFAYDEVKWQNIVFIDETQFSFEDLVKYSDESSEYIPSQAVIDYEAGTITILPPEDEDAPVIPGSEQVWIKAE